MPERKVSILKRHLKDVDRLEQRRVVRKTSLGTNIKLYTQILENQCVHTR